MPTAASGASDGLIRSSAAGQPHLSPALTAATDQRSEFPVMSAPWNRGLASARDSHGHVHGRGPHDISTNPVSPKGMAHHRTAGRYRNGKKNTSDNGG